MKHKNIYVLVFLLTFLVLACNKSKPSTSLNDNDDPLSTNSEPQSYCVSLKKIKVKLGWLALGRSGCLGKGHEFMVKFVA